jgi:hypothetical protein
MVNGTGKSLEGTPRPTMRGPQEKHLYDSLNPEITYALSNGAQPESFYGERPTGDGTWANRSSESLLNDQGRGFFSEIM